MAAHFSLPERRIKLSQEEREALFYLMIDATERPVPRPQKHSGRKAKYSGKKKRHTTKHRIITDNNKLIPAVGPARNGRRHDKRIYDESRVEKPPDSLVPADLGYPGTAFEIPLKASGNRPLGADGKSYNT